MCYFRIHKKRKIITLHDFTEFQEHKSLTRGSVSTPCFSILLSLNYHKGFILKKWYAKFIYFINFIQVFLLKNEKNVAEKLKAKGYNKPLTHTYARRGKKQQQKYETIFYTQKYDYFQ